jgi:phosphoglycerate dehydrogenase-like enzyme
VTRTIPLLMTFEDSALQAALERIEGFGLTVAPDRGASLADISEAEVVCVASFDRELLDRAANLRWIQAYLGGVDRLLFPELVSSPIPLTCVKECFAAPGAEHAMAVILAVSYRLDYYLRAQSRRDFTWNRPDGLASKTLGIIGFGNIGQALAVRARPFGLRTLAIARRPRNNPAPADELLPPSGLPRLLAESDFVVVAVPSTAETRHLIGSAQLSQMRPTAWLVDISGRELVVNQPDVISALNESRIAGADLQFKEPPPADSPLWNMDNLIMSQFSANSDQETAQAIALIADNMQRYRDGQPLRGLVDKAAGY